MARNLQAFNLVVVAALAIGAVVAASAQATPQLTAEAYPATVTATTESKIGAEEEYFEVNGRKIECEVTHFSGSMSAGSSTLTITPDYTDHTQGGNCRASGTAVVTIAENGCDYLIHVTQKTESEYDATTDIVCPAGKAIVVTVRNLLNSGDACHDTLIAQTTTGTKKVRANSPHIDITGTVTEEWVIHSTNTALCGGIPAGTTATEKSKKKTFLTMKGSSKLSVSGE